MGEAVPIKKTDPVKERAAALKVEHGEVWVLSAAEDNFRCIVRRPSFDECIPVKAEIDKSTRGKESKVVAAVTRLFRTACLYPEPDEVTAFLHKFPFAAERLGEKVFDLAGASMAVEVEKV